MPVKNRFAELLPEITAWRRDSPEHPELLYDVHRTAGRVADLLREFGCDEVTEGVGRTGVVGINAFYRDVSNLIELTNTGEEGSEGEGTFVYQPQNVGDGKVWVTPVAALVRVRTGERGADAL